MNIDLRKINIVLVEKENEIHRKGVWYVFNENIDNFYLTRKPILYEEHCKWWESVFDDEYIFLIKFQSEICGYIRLTKRKTENKEKNEISIALLKKYQDMGIGTYAIKLFENELKQLGINKIVSNVMIKNELGMNFFEKNNFKKELIRYIKEI